MTDEFIYGRLSDMHLNVITVSPSSNVDGGFWLRIERNGEDKAGHLSIDDAKILIAILKKAIAMQELE